MHAFSLDLPGDSRCVEKDDFSRCVRLPAVLQTSLSVIPRSRTDRSSALLRAKSNRVPGIVQGTLTELPPFQLIGLTSVGTAREEGDGICRVQVDTYIADRDPQLCDEGDELPDDNEDGYCGGIACTLVIRG